MQNVEFEVEGDPDQSQSGAGRVVKWEVGHDRDNGWQCGGTRREAVKVGLNTYPLVAEITRLLEVLHSL